MLINFEQLIEKLNNRLYFTTADLADILRIKQESARVFATRHKVDLLCVLKKTFMCLHKTGKAIRKKSISESPIYYRHPLVFL